MNTTTTTRLIYTIAHDILDHWPNVNYAAQPYLRAMLDINDMTDVYGAESADMIVRYFLGNATSWRGPDARRIKAELKGMLR